MKYPVSLLAGLILLPLAQMQAQRTPPTPEQVAQHEVSRYTTLLSLNNEQVEEATTAFTAAASSEQSLRATERTAHKAIQAAVKSGDTAAIQQQATSLGQISGERTAARALAEAKFYATLTADQKTKFAELDHGGDRDGEHGDFGHGEHGGPGGPPPAQ